jgi:hypothetical protein
MKQIGKSATLAPATATSVDLVSAQHPSVITSVSGGQAPDVPRFFTTPGTLIQQYPAVTRRVTRRPFMAGIRGLTRASAVLVLCACSSESQLLPPQCPPLCIQQDVSVLTHHNDNARTGAQLNETILSPLSIRASGGLVTRDSGARIQGVVNAQPLYVQGVPLPAGSLDLVYVVDSTNTVYAFSPFENPGHQLVTIAIRTLEPPDGTEMPIQRGILSTPAIDKARNLMYVVARAADSSPAPPPYSAIGNAKFILHVLDLATLADKFPPTTISANVPVPGGIATFVPIVQRQKTALLLNHAGGRSYLSFGFGAMPGSLEEGIALQHGWALTYDVTNAPVLANAYLSTRDPDRVTPPGPAGIWQGGAGFAVDKFGNVFLATGNGDADANHDGDSIVRLTSTGAKFWNAPVPNQAFLNSHDLDLSGGGPVVLPHDGGASRVFIIGKDGSADLVRVYDDIVQNPAIIQSFQAVANPMNLDIFWGDPVYWNGHVYYIGSGDFLKSLSWDPSGGIFTSTTPTNISQNPEPPDEGDPNISCGHRSLSLSADGTSGAILWLARAGGSSNCPGVLDAYDPTTPGSPPFFHWSAPTGIHLARFPMATVAGGRVFLITVNGNGGSTLLEFKK